MVRPSEFSSRGPAFILSQDLGFNPESLGKLRSNSLIRHSRADYYYSRSPIPYSRDLAVLIKSVVQRYYNYEPWNLPEARLFGLPEEYCFEVKRFVIAIIAYYKQKAPPEPLISINILLEGILDKGFAKKLKKFRKQCFLKRIFGAHLEPEILDFPIPPYKIYDIGEIFNYNYWLFWEEEDPEDYKFGMIPEEEINAELLNSFKEALKSKLPECIPKVEELEILLSNSSSKCIDTKGNPGVSVFQEKEVHNYFSNEPLSGKRVLIPVGVDNFRDSVLLSVPQSNSVKLIEKQLSLICQEMIGSTHYKNTDRLMTELKIYAKEYSYFYDRDLTKEGITKPRQLILAILDVLQEKYPDFPCWNYRGIFNNYSLTLENGERLENLRGHGLGMGNSLTTIMQVAVNTLITNIAYEEEQSFGDEISFLTFNDDYSVGFKSETDRDLYIDYDLDICKKLQLLPKPSKSHTGEGFVFCEIYNPLDLNDKISYKLTEIYNIFLLENITHAKEYFSSIQSYIHDMDGLFDKIISYFGFEFYPEEYLECNLLGGWYSPALNGVRLDFWNKSEFTTNQRKAYMACKATVSNTDLLLKSVYGKKRKDLKKKRDKIYMDPISQSFGIHLELPEVFLRRFNILQPYLEVQGEFGVSRKDDIVQMKYKLLFEKRKKIFDEIEYVPSFDDIMKDYLSRYPLQDCLVDYISIKEQIISEVKNEFLTQPYLPNPTLSLIRYYNRDKIKDTIIPSRLSVRYNSLEYAFRREDKNLSLASSKRIPNHQISDHYDIERVERISTDQYFINPSAICTTYKQLTGMRKYPYYNPKNYSREFFESPEESIQNRILGSEYRDVFLKLIEKVGYSKIMDNIDNIVSIIDDIYVPEPEPEIVYPTNLDEECPELERLRAKYNPKEVYGAKDYRQWVIDGRPNYDGFDLNFIKLEDENITNIEFNNIDSRRSGNQEKRQFSCQSLDIIKQSNLILKEGRFAYFFIEEEESSDSSSLMDFEDQADFLDFG